MGLLQSKTIFYKNYYSHNDYLYFYDSNTKMKILEDKCLEIVLGENEKTVYALTKDNKLFKINYERILPKSKILGIDCYLDKLYHARYRRTIVAITEDKRETIERYELNMPELSYC